MSIPSSTAFAHSPLSEDTLSDSSFVFTEDEDEDGTESDKFDDQEIELEQRLGIQPRLSHTRVLALLVFLLSLPLRSLLTLVYIFFIRSRTYFRGEAQKPQKKSNETYVESDELKAYIAQRELEIERAYQAYVNPSEENVAETEAEESEEEGSDEELMEDEDSVAFDSDKRDEDLEAGVTGWMTEMVGLLLVYLRSELVGVHTLNAVFFFGIYLETLHSAPMILSRFFSFVCVVYFTPLPFLI